MTPEEARMWLGDGHKPPIIPPYIAQRALETIAAMGEKTSQTRNQRDLKQPSNYPYPFSHPPK